MTTKEPASRDILDIRAQAGNSCEVCPTCTKPAATPFRRTDDNGTVISGCIDAAHTTHLEGVKGPSADWHFRPVAIDLRIREALRLQTLAAKKVQYGFSIHQGGRWSPVHPTGGDPYLYDNEQDAVRAAEMCYGSKFVGEHQVWRIDTYA